MVEQLVTCDFRLSAVPKYSPRLINLLEISLRVESAEARSSLKLLTS